MRILVCGGRNYSDRDRVYWALDSADAKHGIREVLHGGAGGADSLAHEWAQERQHVSISVMAEWDKNGKRAGPVRNQRMIDEYGPEACIAFKGGSGTADMCRRCEEEGIPVWKVSEQQTGQERQP